MSLCLTRYELVELTEYRCRGRQIAALVAMRIRYRRDQAYPASCKGC